MNKRTAIIIVVFLILGVGGFFCSCTRVRTEKFATVDNVKGIIWIVERGFVACPLTPEGPFPRWSDDLQIQLTDATILSSSTPKTLEAGKDFSTLYNKVQAGKVTLDRNGRTVVVNVVYTQSYWWTRINGRYKIRN